METHSRFQRHPVQSTPQNWVKVTPYSEHRSIPKVVTPTVPGIDLVEWVTNHSTNVQQLLLQHKALLFRGFHHQHSDQFAAFVQHTAQGATLEYRDRSTPRVQMGEKVYTSTVYPARHSIHLHNEGTYWQSYPLQIYFACVMPPETGGETPIANVANVLRRIPPSIREKFIQKGFMLQRNYNTGLGLPWQEVFQTSDRTEVKQFCLENEIEFQWWGDDRLTTRQIRPAIHYHPLTHEPVWFNHVAFFHISTYARDIQSALLSEFRDEQLPYNTYYGDGTEIPPEVIATIREAYATEKVMFPWQSGDILLLDNMTIAHGREPYTGDRLILASMTNPYRVR
jgi:alpha-ketoglutarate-dependent taurine dioxygenase